MGRTNKENTGTRHGCRRRRGCVPPMTRSQRRRVVVGGRCLEPIFVLLLGTGWENYSGKFSHPVPSNSKKIGSRNGSKDPL